MTPTPLEPLPKRVGGVWLDGQLVPGTEAQTNVLSHSLHYGTSVFEGLRIYDGRAFLARAHFQRLAKSAQSLGYVLPYESDALEAALNALVIQNALKDGYARAIAWLGCEALGPSAEGLTVHVAIAAWPWPQVHSGRDGNSGISVCVSDRRRPSPSAVPPQAKAAGGYMIGALALREAHRRNCDDALLCDNAGRIAESTSANLFFVRDSVLCTPLPDGFLNGLTRQTVLQLARGLGLGCCEAHYQPADLYGAEEIFLTGTAVEVLPVTRIDSINLPVGRTTQRLIDAYARAVRDPDGYCLEPYSRADLALNSGD